MKIIFLTLGFLLTVTKITKVVLKTCQGCALKNYPEAMDFIKKDSKKYGDKIKIDYSAGGEPRLVCLDNNDKTLRVLDISKLSQGQIRTVMKKLDLNPIEPLEEIDEKKKRKERKKNKKKNNVDPFLAGMAQNMEL